ncbi:hypothetical protein AK812_SmicGene6960 [Symbiodinium microadriaticum]|uniref:Uncharacterized protein n=1 Tax=Symbiodinium microadriaticum TaxID=2951 RepID=A0A1Q9EPY2_SYMMI|nr:hypothetical protein AK812_SmicGene6960 [Symbiodinium microadriaticum]
MAEVQRPCRKKPPWADLLDEDELRFENQHVILHDPVVRLARGVRHKGPDVFNPKSLVRSRWWSLVGEEEEVEEVFSTVSGEPRIGDALDLQGGYAVEVEADCDD